MPLITPSHCTPGNLQSTCHELEVANVNATHETVRRRRYNHECISNLLPTTLPDHAYFTHADGTKILCSQNTDLLKTQTFIFTYETGS